MEDEKFLGESSNSANNASSINNTNHNSNHRSLPNSISSSVSNCNASGNHHRPASSSSSSSPQKRASTPAIEDSFAIDGDDIGWWDCSLCTYRNSADKFKCEICDLRRGTSTRKPRCNADTIVAQVVKQQEQIRQQTKVKTPKTPRSSTLGPPSQTAATSSNEVASSFTSTKSKVRPKGAGSKSKKQRPKSEFASGNGANNHNSVSQTDEENSDSEYWDSSDSDPEWPAKAKKRVDPSDDENPDNNSDSDEPKQKKKKPSSSPGKDLEARVGNSQADNGDDDDDSYDSDSTDVTDDLTTNQNHRSASESPIDSSHDSFSDASVISPEPTTSTPATSNKNVPDCNSSKIAPFEVNGNLIKYSPPTSSGRTGLIIDKKRFTQHSVTVNDVTITFTEFATRQNKYIRKKKKRRDFSKPKTNNGNGKSRSSTKNGKTHSNSASSTAAGEI